MTKISAGMTMSLDGFVTDRTGDAGPLYADLADLQGAEYMRRGIDETGAVLMGRNTFAMGDPDSYVGNYEYQVPIFVVTHTAPERVPKQDDRLRFTFVTDGVESAAAQAKAAAGDKTVTVVGGPTLIRQLLQAGLVDELAVDVMPVLLGEGLRLFDGSEGTPALEKVDVTQHRARTQLRFTVKH